MVLNNSSLDQTLRVILLCICAAFWLQAHSQDTTWTDADKQSLIDHYLRTQNEVNVEVGDLLPSQWDFKETPTSWSISEVLEHLNMWQLVTLYNVRGMYARGPNPELAVLCPSDSARTTFIWEEKAHQSPDFTIPTGYISGGDNLRIFNFNCDKIVKGIREKEGNFRLFMRGSEGHFMENMNQAYIIHYGHVDRHLRQIRRIKSHVDFPK